MTNATYTTFQSCVADVVKIPGQLQCGVQQVVECLGRLAV